MLTKSLAAYWYSGPMYPASDKFEVLFQPDSFGRQWLRRSVQVRFATYAYVMAKYGIQKAWEKLKTVE